MTKLKISYLYRASFKRETGEEMVETSLNPNNPNHVKQLELYLKHKNHYDWLIINGILEGNND